LLAPELKWTTDRDASFATWGIVDVRASPLDALFARPIHGNRRLGEQCRLRL